MLQIGVQNVSKRTLYKLTDSEMRTFGGCQWELNIPKVTSGTGPLCTSGWIHAYLNPDLAVLFNPIHAAYQPFRLFKAEVDGHYLSDHDMKVGVSELVLREEVEIPKFSFVDLVGFSIFIVRSSLKKGVIPIWDTWAEEILKSRYAHAAARAAAHAAARAAAHAAAHAADAADAAHAAHAAYAAAAAAAVGGAAAAAAAVGAAAAAAAYAAAWSILPAYDQFKTWQGVI
jgi:hypothetical protein